MRERKKTAVHGSLEMTYMAVEFNFQQVLLKTLIPMMNTLKDVAVLNIIKTYSPKAENIQIRHEISDFDVNQFFFKVSRQSV